MVTIPLMNPYETRVLPAVAPSVPRQPAPRHPAPPVRAAAPAPAKPAMPHAAVAPRPSLRRLALPLQGDNWLEIWDDRIITRDQTFTLDDSFNAEVTRDWRAPLTVEAQLGLALRDGSGRWNIYVPRAEDHIWQAASVLRGVCEARGLNLPDLESAGLESDTPQDQRRQPPNSEPVRPLAERLAPAMPAPSKHAYQHDYAPARPTLTDHPAAWMTPQVPHTPGAQPKVGAASTDAAPAGMSSDTVLVAITHLSVLFLPVILPVTVWFALRRTVPWVAGHAREAARYQALVWCLGVLLLGIATLAMVLHGSAVATVGLVIFIILLAAAGVYAFYAVLRATNGNTFRYLEFLRREH